MANEKRLIYVNEILKEKTVLWDTALGFCDCVLVEDIDKAPTVDAVEVVHGRWIEHPKVEVLDGKWISNYECSECCCFYRTHENYCGCCGAMMDGDGNG